MFIYSDVFLMKERRQKCRTNGKQLRSLLCVNDWGLLSKDCAKKHPINYFIRNRDIFMMLALQLHAIHIEYEGISSCLNEGSAVIWHQSSNVIASLNSLKRKVFYHRESSACSFFIFNQALALWLHSKKNSYQMEIIDRRSNLSPIIWILFKSVGKWIAL